MTARVRTEWHRDATKPRTPVSDIETAPEIRTDDSRAQEGTMTDTTADAVERVAAAIWEAEYREMVGEPPYPWDSPEWDEPGHEGQMEIDRAKARAAIGAMPTPPVAVTEAPIEEMLGGDWYRIDIVPGSGVTAFVAFETRDGNAFGERHTHGTGSTIDAAIRDAVRNATEARHD